MRHGAEGENYYFFDDGVCVCYKRSLLIQIAIHVPLLVKLYALVVLLIWWQKVCHCQVVEN